MPPFSRHTVFVLFILFLNSFSLSSFSYLYLQSELLGYKRDNNIATLGVRLFLERVRKHTGKSIQHWLVTELGHEGTENIHLHGVLWTKLSMEEIEKHWQYGFISKGKLNIYTGKYENYVNEKTINYIVKYITKTDLQHKYYKSKVLCSDGIGKKYIHTSNAKRNIYAEGKTAYRSD